jgi:F-type H+-transporting ATPase subunit gamma
MAAQLRVLRRKIRSVQSTKKITRALELIAASRIARAQARVRASRPYAEQITKVLSALASASTLDSPLLQEHERTRRAAVLVITSDTGLCGGYNANLLRRAEQLQSLLHEQGKTPVLYVTGRKGVNYYKFRRRPIQQSWTGFSDKPAYDDLAEVGRVVVGAFLAGAGAGAGAGGRSEDSGEGVDELHLVYTAFQSRAVQTPTVIRVAPLEVSVEETAGPRPSYLFEPDADTLLDELLPKYVMTRIFAAALEAAASENAARQRAMKAATDNADDLIKEYSRQANQARQAQITQEISEIVGGADALASAGAGSDY